MRWFAKKAAARNDLHRTSRLRLERLEDRLAPATFTVADDNVAGLVSAIRQANATTEADTIQLASDGFYGFTQADNNWFGPNALPEITSAITIEGNGSTLERTGIDAMRFFFVSGGVGGLGIGSLTLRGLELSKGQVRGGNSFGGGGGLGAGGAIFNMGNVTLDSVTLFGNFAQGGTSGVPGLGNGGGGMGESAPDGSDGGGFGGTFDTPFTRGGGGQLATGGGGGGFFADAPINAVGIFGHGLPAGGLGEFGGKGGDAGANPGGTKGDGGGGGAGTFDNISFLSLLGGHGGFGGQSNVPNGNRSGGPGGGVGGGGAAAAFLPGTLPYGGGGGGFGGGGGRGGGLGGQGGNGGFGAGGGGSTAGGLHGFGGRGGGFGQDGGIGGGGAGMGGAIFNFFGTVVATNSTFVSNTAQGGSGFDSGDGAGGAITNVNGSVTLTHVTMFNNEARSLPSIGGGAVNTVVGADLHVFQVLLDPRTGQQANATVVLRNSILASPGVALVVTGGRSTPVVTGAGNLLPVFSPFSGQIINFFAIDSVTRPTFGLLQDNGGPVRTLELLAGSSGIGIGNSTFAPPTDARGVTRTGTLSIGAYQASATTFRVEGFPTFLNVGDSGTFTVTAVDPFGKTAFGHTGPVSFSSTSTGELPSTATLAQGTGTFSAKLFTSGLHTLTVTSGAVSGTQENIRVNDPAAETPTVTDAATDEDVPTTGGLVLTRNANDGAEVTHFRITAITGGRLFLPAGTEIQDGDFITADDGAAGLTFAPVSNFAGTASFGVQASLGTTVVGLGGSLVTAAIAVRAVADAPSLALADVTGNEAAAIPLDVRAALVDRDGSESLTIRVSGVPAAVTLSVGLNLGGGVWELRPDELPGLTLSVPDDRSFTLNVTAIATETANGSAVSVSGTIVVQAENVAPVITLRGAASVNEGATYTLTLGAVIEPGSDTVTSYVVHWGDGNSNTYATAGATTHTYADNGNYTISVDVVDEDGIHLAAGTHAVTSTNVAPVPNFQQVAGTLREGSRVYYRATSTDAGVNDVVTYSWRVFRGANVFATGTGANFNFIPNDSGTWRVELTANDGDGGVAMTNRIITVANVNPTATFTNQGPVREGTFVAVVFGSRTDPSTVDRASLRYSYDFNNDGKWDVVNSTTAFARHRFDEVGTSIVRGRISDKDGGFTTYTTSVRITDAPLTATGATLRLTAGASLSGVVATFQDANVHTPATKFRATIAWGDGSSSAGTVIRLSAGRFSVHGVHTYRVAGSYVVTASIADIDGSRATARSTATVLDARLTATGRTLTANQYQRIAGTVASFVDANPRSTAADYRATIQWGDGTSTVGSVISDGRGGFLVQGEHLYRAAGLFSIRVRIVGAGGTITDLFSSIFVRRSMWLG